MTGIISGLDERSDDTAVDAAGTSQLLSTSEDVVLTDSHWLSAAKSPGPVSVSITALTLAHFTTAADSTRAFFIDSNTPVVISLLIVTTCNQLLDEKWPTRLSLTNQNK